MRRGMSKEGVLFSGERKERGGICGALSCKIYLNGLLSQLSYSCPGIAWDSRVAGQVCRLLIELTHT